MPQRDGENLKNPRKHSAWWGAPCRNKLTVVLSEMEYHQHHNLVLGGCVGVKGPESGSLSRFFLWDWLNWDGLGAPVYCWEMKSKGRKPVKCRCVLMDICHHRNRNLAPSRLVLTQVCIWVSFWGACLSDSTNIWIKSSVSSLGSIEMYVKVHSFLLGILSGIINCSADIGSVSWLWVFLKLCYFFIVFLSCCKAWFHWPKNVPVRLWYNGKPIFCFIYPSYSCVLCSRNHSTQ